MAAHNDFVIFIVRLHRVVNLTSLRGHYLTLNYFLPTRAKLERLRVIDGHNFITRASQIVLFSEYSILVQVGVVFRFHGELNPFGTIFLAKVVIAVILFPCYRVPTQWLLLLLETAIIIFKPLIIIPVRSQAIGFRFLFHLHNNSSTRVMVPFSSLLYLLHLLRSWVLYHCSTVWNRESWILSTLHNRFISPFVYPWLFNEWIFNFQRDLLRLRWLIQTWKISLWLLNLTTSLIIWHATSIVWMFQILAFNLS